MSDHLQLVTEPELVCEVCGKAGEIQIYRGAIPLHEEHAPKQWRAEAEEHGRFLHEVRLRLLFDRSPEYWQK